MTTPQQQFIVDIYPAVHKVAQETGVSEKLLLAQAAAETGWGQKTLAGTNNLYNIKADSGWHGESKTFHVPEFRNHHRVMEDAKFRVYGSYEESIKDRIKFVQENPTYAKHGLNDPGVKGNLEGEAKALQAAGYATDPNYAKNLIEIANGPTMRKGLALATGHDQPAHSQGNGKSHAADSHAEKGVLRKNDNSKDVGELQASLQKLGYKNADGTPLGTDHKFGANTEAALKTFQRDHGLKDDGVAGPKTLEALEALKAAQEKSVTATLADPSHKANGLYTQADAGVCRIDREYGREPSLQSSQLSGSLATSAVLAQMSRIDHVVLSDDARTMYAVQGDLKSPFKSMAEVDVVRGLNTPLAQSTQIVDAHLARAATQAQVQQQTQPLQEQAPTHPLTPLTPAPTSTQHTSGPSL